MPMKFRVLDGGHVARNEDGTVTTYKAGDIVVTDQDLTLLNGPAPYKPKFVKVGGPIRVEPPPPPAHAALAPRSGERIVGPQEEGAQPQDGLEEMSDEDLIRTAKDLGVDVEGIETREDAIRRIREA